MRVYVAGGSDERIEVARRAIDLLTARGFTVTHDWTRCEGYDREHSEEERSAWARLDVEGVKSADVVWLMAPSVKSEGAATEIGIAIGRGVPFVISGPRARGNIFSMLATMIFDNHVEALASFESIAAARGLVAKSVTS